MNAVPFVALGGVLFVVTVLFTGLIRRYAVNHMVDVPNVRSSHRTPTPRGGGLALVIAFLLGITLTALSGRMDGHALLALLGGVPVAAIGFYDDHGHVAARWRFLVYAASAVWSVGWVGGMAPQYLFGISIDLGWFGDVVTVLLLVWLTNLYNFMDGIDGLAGSEAVSVAAGAALLLVGIAQTSAHLNLLLMAVSLGFLVWNWPPARIFMGDVGSSYIGFTLGVLMLLSDGRGELSLSGWLILMGVFFVDATFTLLRRIWRRERWYEAHRSHAYQHAAQRFGHRTVTLAVIVLNLLWLWPMAWIQARFPTLAPLPLFVAYLPLLGVALYFKAGLPPTDCTP